MGDNKSPETLGYSHYGVNQKKGPACADPRSVKQKTDLARYLYPSLLPLGDGVFKALLFRHGQLESVSNLDCPVDRCDRSLMGGKVVLTILANVYLVPHALRYLRFRLVCKPIELGPSQIVSIPSSPTTLPLPCTSIHTPRCLHRKNRRLIRVA